MNLSFPPNDYLSLVLLAEALVFVIGLSILIYRSCCGKRAEAAASTSTPVATDAKDEAPAAPAEDGDGVNQLFDDYFFKFCGCCLPCCFPGMKKDEIFAERTKLQLRDRKLELHLDSKLAQKPS